MLYSEWIKNQSLFTEINNIRPFPFITEQGTEDLDLLYLSKYGSKPVPLSVEHLTVLQAAKIIVISYGDNWTNKYNLLKDKILLGVDNKKVDSETTTDNTNKAVTTNSDNKISAYNDEEMVNNNSSIDSVNDDTTKEHNVNKETTNTSLTAVKTQLELFNSSFIIDVVCRDISKVLSLSIY